MTEEQVKAVAEALEEYRNLVVFNASTNEYGAEEMWRHALIKIDAAIAAMGIETLRSERDKAEALAAKHAILLVRCLDALEVAREIILRDLGTEIEQIEEMIGALEGYGK